MLAFAFGEYILEYLNIIIANETFTQVELRVYRGQF